MLREGEDEPELLLGDIDGLEPPELREGDVLPPLREGDVLPPSFIRCRLSQKLLFERLGGVVLLGVALGEEPPVFVRLLGGSTNGRSVGK